MPEIETHHLADDGRFPNSRLPLLIYRHALPADADAMIAAFAEHGWSNAWRNGIFTYHHFHSIAHEVLGVARGEARVTFGGPHGRTATVTAGDVAVIPAGVAHRNIGQSDDFLVVGAYPDGGDYDILRGAAVEYEVAKRAAAAVSSRVGDPVVGNGGVLGDVWCTGRAGRRSGS